MSIALPTVDGTEAFTGVVSGVSSEELLVFFKFAAVVDALGSPAVRARLVELGHQIFPREQQTPSALAALHRAELKKWLPIIKAANVRAE